MMSSWNMAETQSVAAFSGLSSPNLPHPNSKFSGDRDRDQAILAPYLEEPAEELFGIE